MCRCYETLSCSYKFVWNLFYISVSKNITYDSTTPTNSFLQVVHSHVTRCTPQASSLLFLLANYCPKKPSQTIWVFLTHFSSVCHCSPSSTPIPPNSRFPTYHTLSTFSLLPTVAPDCLSICKIRTLEFLYQKIVCAGEILPKWNHNVWNLFKMICVKILEMILRLKRTMSFVLLFRRKYFQIVYVKRMIFWCTLYKKSDSFHWLVFLRWVCFLEL